MGFSSVEVSIMLSRKISLLRIRFSEWITPISFLGPFTGKNMNKAASLCDNEEPEAFKNPYNPLIYIFVSPTSGGNAAAPM